MARIRTLPEDFEVEEIPRFPPSGEGAFAYLWVEKRLENTDDVARNIAAALSLQADQVAYAGRKDKRAVARQYFSLPWQDPQRLFALPIPGARILKVERHDQRLGPGKLDGNRFHLKVREVDAETAAEAARRAAEIEKRGLANRFGKQRYGRDGDNAAKGRDILLGKGPRGDRRSASFLVSALQSQLFDLVLTRRPIDRLLPGDVGFVHATGETLWLRGEPEEQEKADRFELSPTGPILGSKMKQPRHEAARIEREAAEELGLPRLDRIEPPPGMRLFGDRRSLRVKPRELALDYHPEEQMLDLRCVLPPGSYATVLLEELLPGGFDEGENQD
jgi:tRNA pseudouridine13 synthase